MILTFLFGTTVRQSKCQTIDKHTHKFHNIRFDFHFSEFYLLLDFLQFKIESKMTTNFKYTLTKSLRSYTKYIPQLSKPVLRVLIQGKRELELITNFRWTWNWRLSICSFRALHRKQKLSPRSPQSRPDQAIANGQWNSREFLWIVCGNFANNAIVFAHTKGLRSWRRAAGMLEGIALQWRVHRRHCESAEHLSGFVDTKLLRSEESTHSAKAIQLVHQFVIDWKVCARALIAKLVDSYIFIHIVFSHRL